MNDFTSTDGTKYAVRQNNGNDIISMLSGYTLVTQEELNNMRSAAVISDGITGIVAFFVGRSERKAAKLEAARAVERRAEVAAARAAREAKWAAEDAARDAKWEAVRVAREAGNAAHDARMADIASTNRERREAFRRAAAERAAARTGS